MKKIIVQYMTLLFVVTASVVCNTVTHSNDSRDLTPKTGLLNDNQIAFNAKYIRTTYAGGAISPFIAVISSKNELEIYCENYKGLYNLSARSNVYSDSMIGFADAVKNYSDEYFTDNFLVIILIQEGSGSIRHKVERIDENGNIIVNRLMPEIGTTDMAAWYIIIELNKYFRLREFRVEFMTFKIGD
ncbi:MAG: hypothetical protein FWG92_00290 [Leptospirales bacterium]|nr:hypothetical protein [Leptospirales bacterium]